jgi:glycosyltransferase involved in cell wall biosynthesis
VGVTRQIAAFEKQRVFRNPDYPVEAVSNGYDVESVSHRTPPPFDGHSLRILVVANFAAWHGLDRLIQGLAEYRGDVDIKLDGVGDGAILAESRQAIADAGLETKVIFHGKLYGNSLDTIYDQCHLATGSLGLHRIGMTEASTLKVRECWARGIPFLLTYEDTDHLQSKEMSSYYWCGAMDDSPIPMNQVVNFARSILADPNHAERMREIARTTVDMGVKMKRLKEFLEKVANRLDR